MKITRRALRKIIVESLMLEGAHDASADQWAKNFMNTMQAEPMVTQATERDFGDGSELPPAELDKDAGNIDISWDATVRAPSRKNLPSWARAITHLLVVMGNHPGESRMKSWGYDPDKGWVEMTTSKVSGVASGPSDNAYMSQEQLISMYKNNQRDGASFTMSLSPVLD
tara:strand:- start:1189 stop:1695 length:507 start_codon:yes stop_codon:yes gene_type:complete